MSTIPEFFISYRPKGDYFVEYLPVVVGQQVCIVFCLVIFYMAAVCQF